MRRVSLILLPVLLAGSLAACGGSSDNLPTASGKFGEKPKVTVAKGSKPPKTLKSEVLSEGNGPVVKKGNLLVADYLGEVYKTGKVFDNSYDRKVPAAFPIGTGSVIPGWDKTLVGVKAGSRVLLSIPPKQGYGTKGNPQAGIKGTDTLVFVVDVIASYPKSGNPEKNTPVANLPTDIPKVSGTSGTPPTISVPQGTTPPKDPVVTVLAKGNGAAAKKGDLAVVEYSAVDWTGKALSSSWQQGPQGVAIGGPQPSPFDLLAGVPVGSRVLLTLPAQTGTDAAKQSVAVVIDVLGLHGPTTGSAK
ncbi:MAG TPA: FKBP-type peptidyl-prolyl cis-trans isomerase [Actinomycetes bacterium]|nr:FKBP-type peptidyl-prolyl cis-trans isomerase [Actinomycetes bacterium]